jgi:NDP-sugar pyrophosphorylase family protein
MSLSVFFLCAGYGSRLRPLTDRVPKPGIPFLGQSALEINARAAEALGPDQRVANAHHLPEAIRALAKPLGIDVLFEPAILGTGGCLANGADVLRRTDHFLVHNADLIHAIDLPALYREHRESGALATLAGLNIAGAPNTLSMSGGGWLLGVHGFNGFAGDSGEAKRLTFAGIAFYRREFLDFVTPGAEDIKPFWIRALENSRNKTGAPERDQRQPTDSQSLKHERPRRESPPLGAPRSDTGSITTRGNTAERRSQPGEATDSIGSGAIQVVDCSGTPWYDFGTPQGLWEALKYRMESTGTFAHHYAAPADDRPYVANESGAAKLAAGLKRVAVYEVPKIPLEEGTTNLLTGRDFDWKIRP